VLTVNTNVFILIEDFHIAKTEAVREHWSEKFIMVSRNIDDSCASLCITQYSSHDIGVTLFPAPLVLLYFPSIDYITYKVKRFACIVF
jgi:hypothetical protein